MTDNAWFDAWLQNIAQPSLKQSDVSGGHVVPDAFIDDALLRITKVSAWMPMSDEMREDLGYPPRAKGLRYWQNRERQAIAAAHPVARLRRRYRSARWFLKHDMPTRLRNARAALAGEWERSDDDD